MKTLLVKVINSNKSKLVRPFIDGGSQKSQKTAEELGIESCETELLSHALFSGVTSGTKSHKILKIKTIHPTVGFTRAMEMLETPAICGNGLRTVDEGTQKEESVVE